MVLISCDCRLERVKGRLEQRAAGLEEELATASEELSKATAARMEAEAKAREQDRQVKELKDEVGPCDESTALLWVFFSCSDMTGWCIIDCPGSGAQDI